MRNRIIEAMRSQNIQTQIGTYSLHIQPVFKHLKKIGSLENSLTLYNQLLALPLHHQLKVKDQKKVVNELIKVIKKQQL